MRGSKLRNGIQVRAGLCSCFSKPCSPNLENSESVEKLRGFSTPDEIARFKSVEWVIGYVLGMGNPDLSQKAFTNLFRA